MQDHHPLEPVLLFTRPVDPEKLGGAGIVVVPPLPLPSSDNSSMKHHRHHHHRHHGGRPSSSGGGGGFGLSGRVGRGGRIVFDRWNPLLLTPIQWGNSFYMPPKPRPSPQTHN